MYIYGDGKKYDLPWTTFKLTARQAKAYSDHTVETEVEYMLNCIYKNIYYTITQKDEKHILFWLENRWNYDYNTMDEVENKIVDKLERAGYDISITKNVEDATAPRGLIIVWDVDGYMDQVLENYKIRKEKKDEEKS